MVPHERCDLSAILSWYDLRRIFPQGGRRTTLQGGFRKEVGRKKVTFGHYSPIQYTIRIYVVSTIYCMYIMLYYTIYCYYSRMGGGKPLLCFLRVAGYGYKLFVRGLICPKSNYWSIYGIFFAPPHPNSIINCMIIKSQLLTFHSQR